MTWRTTSASPRAAGRALATAGLLAAVALLSAAVVPVAAGYTPMLIRSGSMGRAAPVGSVVLGRHVEAGTVQAGDVVLLPRADAPVLHRVLTVQRDQGQVTVTTKGDANPDPDSQPTVLPSRVVRARWTLPYVGHAFRFAQTPAGWALLVLGPTAALLALFLVRLWAPPSAPPAQGWSLPQQPAPAPAALPAGRERSSGARARPTLKG